VGQLALLLVMKLRSKRQPKRHSRTKNGGTKNGGTKNGGTKNGETQPDVHSHSAPPLKPLMMRLVDWLL
jgi:hypothetical protein